MRLGAPEPINLDLRNELLREIKAGRQLKAKTESRAATVPAGRPTPFEADQAAYEAALRGFAQADPTVTSLGNRLTSMPGPYWMDLTQQEKDALALWNEALKNLDEITYRYYPSPIELDYRKILLLAIGVGAIFGPLFFTKDSDVGFPFPVVPKAPELPFGRAPRGLPAPVRPEATAIPYRQVQRSSLPSAAVPVSSSPIAKQVLRAGYTPPPRFSRSFAGSEGAAPAGGLEFQKIPGNVIRRQEGGRRFINPNG